MSVLISFDHVQSIFTTGNLIYENNRYLFFSVRKTLSDIYNQLPSVEKEIITLKHEALIAYLRYTMNIDDEEEKVMITKDKPSTDDSLIALISALLTKGVVTIEELDAARGNVENVKKEPKTLDGHIKEQLAKSSAMIEDISFEKLSSDFGMDKEFVIIGQKGNFSVKGGYSKVISELKRTVSHILEVDYDRIEQYLRNMNVQERILADYGVFVERTK